MKKLIPAFVAMAAMPSFANEAVQDFNGSAALSYLHSSDFAVTAGDIDFKIPLGYNLGLGIHGGLNNSDGRNDDYIDYDGSQIGAELFVREQNLFKVGFDYTAESIELSRGSDQDLDVYTLFGEYYYKQFNFTANRAHTNTEFEKNGDSWTVGLNYYPNANTRLDLEAGGMDKRDDYTLRATLQPSFFNNTASFNVGYIDGHEQDAVFAGIQYYFGATTTLVKRDRNYR